MAMTDEERKLFNLAEAKRVRQDWLDKYKYEGQQGKSKDAEPAFRTRSRYISGGKEALPTHEDYFPGAQRMAMEAGAGGYKAFTPAGRNYQAGIRKEMFWLPEGQKYTSADWYRLLANRQGPRGAQIGGAPAGRAAMAAARRTPYDIYGPPNIYKPLGFGSFF